MSAGTDVADLRDVHQVVGFAAAHGKKTAHRVDEVEQPVAPLGHLDDDGAAQLLAAGEVDQDLDRVAERYELLLALGLFIANVGNGLFVGDAKSPGFAAERKKTTPFITDPSAWNSTTGCSLLSTR